MHFLSDEEDDESLSEKEAREQERKFLQRLRGYGNKNPEEQQPWNIIDTGTALYKLFESAGISHATPEQYRKLEKRNIH